MSAKTRTILLALTLVGALLPTRANAVLFKNFPEYNTTVNGYQDDFTGTSFNAGWTSYLNGANTAVGSQAVFTLPGDGRLHMGPAGGDPNKLLYNGAAYDGKTQNTLALIRITDTNAPINNGLWRGGVSAATDTLDGRGINVMFKTAGSEGTGSHVQILNDAIAWGNQIPDATFQWSPNTWYFLRLTHDASENAVAHIWPADNATPESSAFTVSNASFGVRSGLAGLATNSGANGTFEVDYFLLQASGLPSIAVVPEPSSIVLLLCGAIGMLCGLRRRGR